LKKLTQEEKRKIRLICKVFEAQEIMYQGVSYNPPKQEKK